MSDSKTWANTRAREFERIVNASRDTRTAVDEASPEQVIGRAKERIKELDKKIASYEESLATMKLERTDWLKILKGAGIYSI